MNIDAIIKECKDKMEEGYQRSALILLNGNNSFETKEKFNACVSNAMEYELVVKALEELKKYKELEKSHLLLKLPCKIGDKIYHIENNQMKEFVVSSFDIRPLQAFACNDEEKRINIKQFGKTVFLSKEEATLHIKTQEEKYMSTESLIGKRYLDKQRLPGALKEVVDGPNEWGSYVVKDLKTGKKHLCGRIYIMENEVDEKSFEEWWDELDDIGKEEYK